MEHKLKILTEYFKAVVEGTKTFEIRKNDRNFKVGDNLLLEEWVKFDNPIDGYANGFYTGQEIIKEVTYILEGGKYGLEKGYCILGLKTPFKEDVLNKSIEEFGMNAKMIQETYDIYIWIIEYYKDAIKLKNIDLSGINLIQELNKRDEEYRELSEAITIFLATKGDISAKKHLLEEACDNIQVILSTLKILDIDIEEISDYWSTKHLEKLKNRPRKADN